MSVIASIDVGSNAIRLFIARFTKGGRYKILESVRAPVRLGADAFSTGTFSPATINRTVETFKDFKKLIRKHKVQAVGAVATSAMRDAKNGEGLVKKVFKESGIKIKIISGEEEAKLISAAIKNKIKVGNRISLLLDIGGGSVETTIIRGNQVLFSESVKLGTVRLLNLIGKRKDGPERLQRLVSQYAAKLKRKLGSQLSKKKISLCIGTGGNIEEFGLLRKKVLKAKMKDRITSGELDQLMRMLSCLSPAERVKVFELKADRADVIVPAGVVVQAVMREAKVEEIRIPGVGLKEGVLLDLWHFNMSSHG